MVMATIQISCVFLLGTRGGGCHQSNGNRTASLCIGRKMNMPLLIARSSSDRRKQEAREKREIEREREREKEAIYKIRRLVCTSFGCRIVLGEW